MSRSYTATDVIDLPRMTAASAHALGTAMLAAALEFGAPKPAKRALERLSVSFAELNAAMVALARKKKHSPEVIQADRVIDDCWGAFHAWLGGWKRLPGAPNALRAASVHDAVFLDGMGFILLPYAEEWSESGIRLQRLGEGDHEKVVADLGGKEFVVRLRAAHKTYGELLGITSAGTASDPTVGTRRPQLAAFGEVLRAYVLKVAAFADADDPASEALVANLLLPLVEHRDRAVASPAADSPTPA